MNSQWLKSFVAAARAGSISGAAEQQFVSPQALTQQINLLEEELGFKLFARSTKGVRLTEAGTAFYDGLARMDDLWHATIARCQRAPVEAQTIVTPVSAAFSAGDIEDAYHEYQRVKSPDEPNLLLVVSEDYKNWIRGLRDGTYDFVRYVRVGGVHPKGMHFEPVRDLKPWCLMAPTHPLADKDRIAPEDLDGMSVSTLDMRVLRRLIDVLEALGLTVSLLEIPVSSVHILDTVSSGGICIYTENFAQSFSGCRAVPLALEIDTWEGLLCHEERVDDLRHVLDICKRHMAATAL